MDSQPACPKDRPMPPTASGLAWGMATAGGEMADLFDRVLEAVQVKLTLRQQGAPQQRVSELEDYLHAPAGCKTFGEPPMVPTSNTQASPDARATLPAMRLTSRRWRDIVDDSIKARF